MMMSFNNYTIPSKYLSPDDVTNENVNLADINLQEEYLKDLDDLGFTIPKNGSLSEGDRIAYKGKQFYGVYHQKKFCFGNDGNMATRANIVWYGQFSQHDYRSDALNEGIWNIVFFIPPVEVYKAAEQSLYIGEASPAKLQPFTDSTVEYHIRQNFDLNISRISYDTVFQGRFQYRKNIAIEAFVRSWFEVYGEDYDRHIYEYRLLREGKLVGSILALGDDTKFSVPVGGHPSRNISYLHRKGSGFLYKRLLEAERGEESCIPKVIYWNMLQGYNQNPYGYNEKQKYIPEKEPELTMTERVSSWFNNLVDRIIRGI